LKKQYLKNESLMKEKEKIEKMEKKTEKKSES
jgi:hypothetical protein